MATVQSSALEYLARGWSVIPIRAHDKRPLLPWQGYQHRRATPEEIAGWFRHSPEPNVAIVTGAISGLVVLDVDVAHGGEASLAGLVHEHAVLPPTLEARTGGGGRHLYFTHPGGVVHNQVALADGIDLRGDGGYVVAPPSLHPKGIHYAWRPGHGPDEIAPAQLPRWLLEQAHAGRERVGHPRWYWRRLVQAGVEEGARNNSIASLTGHLLWHGVDQEVVLELLLCWNRIRCRPPLADEEVVRTVESITRLHERNALP